AVTRFENVTVEFLSYNKEKYTEEKAITILNESGLKYAFNPVYYTKSKKIMTYTAIMYDASGKEIKKYKSREINDASTFDGFSLFTDNRVQYFNVVPISYPFTIYYKVETISSSTISLSYWNPVMGYDLGVENSTFKLINETNIPIRKLEEGFEGYGVQKSEEGKTIVYSLQNIAPIQDEILSPPLQKLVPLVRFSPTEFELEGVLGKFENWEQFGKWYYDTLLSDKQDLSEAEKNKARQLVSGTEDPVEKVRILYQYMQSKTRYINVAIGIGGWEPFPASFVSTKSYGDCKALSNYMISLLEAVGIKGYHTVVYGEKSRKVDVEKDFASLQGNHMIVNVPLEGQTLWLECTNQQTAFNYLGLGT
ncbi:MAG: DUF3857 domain-containing protein, partial [Vibrio fluvialis]